MSAPIQRRHLAELIYLDEFRQPADLIATDQLPAVGAGMPHRRATLAVCWHRSQLRRDLIERGTGLLVGVVALTALLWVLSVAGWLPR